MNKKIRIVEAFLQEIEKRIGKDIYSIYLFGSLAKGTYHNGSDIDILLIYSDDRELDKVEEVVDEVCLSIACEYGEAPEVVLMSFTEYKNGLGNSPFLWEVLNHGKPMLVKGESTEWMLDFKDYLKLAEEYLSYAKDALKNRKIRLAIDSAYNSAELLSKSLIISAGNELASSHGGIVGQFGKIFIMSGKMSKEVGKGLNKALRLRALARYRPDAKLTLEDANIVVSLAEEIMEFAKSELKT